MLTDNECKDRQNNDMLQIFFYVAEQVFGCYGTQFEKISTTRVPSTHFFVSLHTLL